MVHVSSADEGAGKALYQHKKIEEGGGGLPVRALKGASYAGYFGCGLLLTAVGPTLPSVEQSYGLPISALGLVFLIQSTGFLISVFLGGALSDTYGRKPLMLIGAGLMGLSLMAVGAVGSWPMLLLLLGVAGLGFGTFESAINALIVDLSDDRHGADLNVLHLFPAFGAIVGPYVASAFLGVDWRLAYAVTGLVIAGSGLWLAFCTFPPYLRQARPQLSRQFGLLRHPLILLLAVVMFLYVGAENGVSGWVYTYLTEGRLAAPALGTLALAGYWAGLCLARIISSRLVEGFGYGRFLIGTSLFSLLAFALLLWPDAMGLNALGAGLVGLGYGAIFPTTLAQATRLFPTQAGAISGVLIAACSLGGMSIPSLMGPIAGRFNLGWAMALVALTTAALCAAVMGIDRLSARSVANPEADPATQISSSS